MEGAYRYRGGRFDSLTPRIRSRKRRRRSSTKKDLCAHVVVGLTTDHTVSSPCLRVRVRACDAGGVTRCRGTHEGRQDHSTRMAKQAARACISAAGESPNTTRRLLPMPCFSVFLTVVLVLFPRAEFVSR